MRIFKLTFLFFVIFSCNERKKEQKFELTSEKKDSEIITQEEKIDSIYEIYKKGKVESFDWNLVFDKAEEYREVSDKSSDKNQIPKDFLEFSKRFVSEPDFQKEHIDFYNLIAVVGAACEETYVLGENNWVFDDWDFVNNIKINDEVENVYYFSENIFFAEYQLIEIGTITMLGFEKKDNKWFLTLFFHNDC